MKLSWKQMTLFPEEEVESSSHFGFNTKPYIEGEIWKDIPLDDFKGLYQVSNLGRVKSLVRNMKCRAKTEKVLKQCRTSGDYLSVPLYNGGIYKRFPAHRLVALAFLPNPQNKCAVNHKDFDRSNNRVENLEWCTTSENIRHNHLEKKVKGQKLTYSDALRIRCLYSRGENGYTQKQLAKMYNITKSNIGQIIRFERWKFYDN